MAADVQYGSWERFWLWAMAIVGLVSVNGTFLYGALVRPEALAEAMRNPVAVAFQVEALLLLAALTYLLARWGVTRVPRAWFVGLAIFGSLAFALPVALLWSPRSRPGASFEE